MAALSPKCLLVELLCICWFRTRTTYYVYLGNQSYICIVLYFIWNLVSFKQCSFVLISLVGPGFYAQLKTLFQIIFFVQFIVHFELQDTLLKSNVGLYLFYHVYVLSVAYALQKNFKKIIIIKFTIVRGQTFRPKLCQLLTKTLLRSKRQDTFFYWFKPQVLLVGMQFLTPSSIFSNLQTSCESF